MIPSFLNELPIIGIFRGISHDAALPAAAAAARSGIGVLEVTMNSEDPIGLIAAICREVPGVTVGAGTVMSLADLDAALAAGAQFIVCPHVDEEIVRRCADSGIPIFPGAMTPTEVWRAHHAGATMVKLFPAGTLGPNYIRALRGPLPQIDLLVTGGVDAGNLADFLAAGARGAAVGGRLFPKDALHGGDVTAIEGEAMRLVEAYRAYVTRRSAIDGVDSESRSS